MPEAPSAARARDHRIDPLPRLLQRRLKALTQEPRDLLVGGLKGIEKESLRITRDGRIAQSPHPRALGSALTHPYLTTDYSEALLELRTPPLPDIRETLQSLRELHQFVYQHLGEELLWTASMPCVIESDESIPIAQYGSSNVGRMKHVYRRGLDYRYGRAMQAIAGVHFNYSLPERFWPAFQAIEGDKRERQAFVSDGYFALIRNFQRLGWVIPYLFGSSPAVCKSFLHDRRPTGFAEFDPGTYFKPYATSLRMSDIGYKNKTQANLRISYNNVEEYVATLSRAIETPYPEYERIGVVVDGEYRQLSANLLQIENEYYSFVRPKQVAHSGEKPTLALKRRGVQYVEVRALDVDMFEPLGVSEAALRFLQAFLLYCLLEESPPISADEQQEFDYNQRMVADYGRDPSLGLQRRGHRLSLKDWGGEICEIMQGLCELLDKGQADRPYAQALTAQAEVLADPTRTPSAQVLAQMWEKRESFASFGMRLSTQHERDLKAQSLPEERQRYFRELAEQSHARQREIEAADDLSFEEYLRRYFAQS